METKEWGKPNTEIDNKTIDTIQQSTSLMAGKPTKFRSVGKMYKKIAGKRYRIPRKAKKRFKTNMCKHGLDIKKLKFSYTRPKILSFAMMLTNL